MSLVLSFSSPSTLPPIILLCQISQLPDYVSLSLSKQKGPAQDNESKQFHFACQTNQIDALRYAPILPHFTTNDGQNWTLDER